MSDASTLVKVFVDLPHHWDSNGESMWARALGGDLYELHNSPFSAYDLNYLDVVVAISVDPDKKPQVRSIDRRSGHRTLRFIFKSDTDREARDRMLAELGSIGTTYEGSNYTLFSLDIPPDQNYQAVCDKLWEWEQSGLLEYETCEARVPGSFDGAPKDS
jgi:hypothetical protein